MSRSRDLGDVGSKANFLDNVSTDLGDFSGQSIPHIIPDVLYPAVEGKDLAGVAFSGSYIYGTAHTDNRKYYYTDIKGSKPIKDPRIGGHFGSQRHKFKSLQLLEQETATHGKDVYSIDGREWAKVCGTTFVAKNDANGNRIYSPGVNGTDFFEIVGYFSHINLLHSTHSARPDNCDVIIDGTDVGTNHSQQTTVASPLGDRYVDASSVSNVSLGSTALGIHTLKYIPDTTGSSDCNIYGIELIAQDTSNRNNIQIPSQNVVSNGKKFTVNSTNSGFPATGLHYNPFAFKTDGSTAWTSGAHNGTSLPVGTGSSHNIDTATSLGLENWKHTDGNYYKPYNGGRVVLWIDNTGVLKTSVTVMPPLAKSIADSNNLTPSASSNNIGASSANSEYRPYFGQDDAYDASGKEAHDGLHEVAKTFYAREFGNGSANGGTEATYADASMLSGSSDNIAYVMDDGLTSLSGNDLENGDATYKNLLRTNQYYSNIYLTFIGTGLSLRSGDPPSLNNFVNNLPYGTHVFQVRGDAGSSNYDILIDGVEVRINTTNNIYLNFEEFTFYQPKKPPIPEDAVVLADYMLLADFVKQTDIEPTHISKGVRALSGTRDVFYNSANAFAENSNIEDGYFPFGYEAVASNNSSGSTSAKLVFFGTNAISLIQDSTQAHTIDFAGSTDVAKTALDSSVNYRSDGYSINADATLGLNEVTTNIIVGGWGWQGYYLATPIHTSSHYQAFETPFLYELVGGDRNMEQTNLVCSPDGKSWDEVTRDTSYIGGNRISVTEDTETTGASAAIIFTDHRGLVSGSTERNLFNKGFAIGYDRFICLENGNYIFSWIAYNNASGGHEIRFTINDQPIIRTYKSVGSASTPLNGSYHCKLERGDFIRLIGSFGTDGPVYSSFTVTKV